MTTDEPDLVDVGRRPLRVAPLEGLGTWIATVIATLVAYQLVSRGVMSWAAGWQVPLFVGAVAGLAASSFLQGGIIAGCTVGAALVAFPPTTTGPGLGGVGGWFLGVVLALVAACAVRALRASHTWGPASVERWLAALLVVWLLGNLWAPLLGSGLPPAAYGPLKASTLRAVPQLHAYVNDDTLYLRIFYELHHGRAYYGAFSAAWSGLAQRPAFPSSVTSVRLPTMYWLWKLLPPDPFSLAYLFLGFVSVGVVAAAWIAGQLAGARFAPLAAAALVAFAMGSGTTVYLTYIDLPTTCVALVGVALFLRGRISGTRRWLWAAAVVLTAAALTREILIYITLLALASSLLEPREVRWQQAAPWLASLVVFAAGYAAHAAQVSRMMVARSAPITYFKGSPLFAIDSFRRFTNMMGGNGFLLFLLFVLALAAAIASRRRAGLSFAVFATGALVAPFLTMLKVGNPGIDAMGFEVNYWGNLYIPLALALWPAWVLWLPMEDTSSK